MKILYILNYQREVPPFAIIEVSYAKKMFDKVVYITRKLDNDNSYSIRDSNVEFIQISFYRRCVTVLRILILLFSKRILLQLYNSFKHNVFSASYIKNLLRELYVSEQLYIVCKQHSENKQLYEKYVLSCWFNGTAIAAAKLQHKLHYKSYSFAHAFEVNPLRNKFVGFLLEGYKHENLTKISFISEIVKNMYTKRVYPVIGNQTNAVLDYLGTVKHHQESVIKTDKFTICSCSTVHQIKRLDLLIEALSHITHQNIHWIHIGDGPDFTRIKNYAKSILPDNIEFCFLGKLPNEDVQSFYSQIPVDLFINVSESEGLPVSIMEAMSYSIPCMATDVGGTSEIVNSNNGVLLSKDILPIELSAKIIDFIQMDSEIKIRMKQAAFENWNNKFNADRNITKYFAKMISDEYEE